MRICIECNQYYEEPVFRCKNCTKLLILLEWTTTSRDIKSPIKASSFAKLFNGTDIDVNEFIKFDQQITQLNNVISAEIFNVVSVFFEGCVENNIIKNEKNLNVEIEMTKDYTLAWVSACYFIGLVGEKNKIEDNLRFNYIHYLTDAYLVHILKYPWALYSQKLLSQEKYMEFITGFSLLVCYKNAFKSEKEGYLESFLMGGFNGNFMSNLNKVINEG